MKAYYLKYVDHFNNEIIMQNEIVAYVGIVCQKVHTSYEYPQQNIIPRWESLLYILIVLP